MKILQRHNFSPKTLLPNDSLTVIWSGYDGDKILATTKIAEYSMTIDECILFTSEFDGRRTIGMMVLEAVS